MKSRVIVLLGPAGVGKTTQLQLLQEYFHSNNRSTMRSYVKSFHPRLLGYVAQLANRGTDSTTIDLPLARNLMKRLPLIDLFAVIGLYFFSVKIFSVLGRIVLVEESLPGTAMEYLDAYRKNFISKELTDKIADFLFRFIKKEGAIVVILLTDLSTLRKRLQNRGFRLERDPYLKSEIIAIGEMRHILGDEVILINENAKDVLEIHKMIVSRLPLYLKSS